MRQQTLAEASFEKYRKTMRREIFLAEMEKVVPGSEWCSLIEPVYPKGDGVGRPPEGLQRILRVYFLRLWFNLSDPAVEEARYDSRAMRGFVGIDLGSEPVPDETTVLNFRHLLEAHDLGPKIFERVGQHLQAQGLKINTGTMVDATIISAPSSTKNRDRQRDPKMHSTKQGNQWHFYPEGHKGIEGAYRHRQPDHTYPYRRRHARQRA